METSAAETLASFDTGYWTYYALPRDYSDLDYQTYVVQLLTKLAPDDPRFADASKRFARTRRNPRPSSSARPAWARCASGSRSRRPSRSLGCRAVTPAFARRRLDTLAWPEPKRPGSMPSSHAVDRAGNQCAFEALPIVRRRAAAPAASRAEQPARRRPRRRSWSPQLDDPAQGRSREARTACVRVGIAWPAAAAVPDPGLIAALQRVPGPEVIAELARAPCRPTTPAARHLPSTRRRSRSRRRTCSSSILTPGAERRRLARVRRRAAAVRDAVHAGLARRRGRRADRRRGRPEGDVAALGRALGGVAAGR